VSHGHAQSTREKLVEYIRRDVQEPIFGLAFEPAVRAVKQRHKQASVSERVHHQPQQLLQALLSEPP
jgi:hypothetical protein